MQIKCLECNKSLSLINYYKLRRQTDEYPHGVIPICKKCATKNFKVDNPASFMAILRELDLPWMPTQYVEVCAKSPEQVGTNSPAILGRYIARCKLVQFSEYDFHSSLEAQCRVDPKSTLVDDPVENYDKTLPVGQPTFERPPVDLGLSELKNASGAPALKGGLRAPASIKDDRSKYLGLGTILQEENDELIATARRERDLAKMASLEGVDESLLEEVREDLYNDAPPPSLELPEIDPLYEPNTGIKLTKEEAYWLVSKWGDYSLAQLLTLERNYLEMMEDFDIRTSIHKNYLRKLCVCSLRMDELLAAGEFTAAKAAAAMFESVTKAANLQPIQDKNASNTGEFCLGTLVKKCESVGFIPKYFLADDINPDIVDKTIKDQQLYLKRLVDNDGTIVSRFEQEAVALLEAEQEKKRELELGADYIDEDIFDEYQLLKEYEELEAIPNGNSGAKV